MRRFATSRLIGCAFALSCLGFSVQLAIVAYRIHAEVREALNTRPMETAIDFSQTGEKIVPFRQTFGRAHGELLLFECDLRDDARPSVDKLFSGLSGTVTIVDKDGNQLDSVTFSDKSPIARDDAFLLHRLARFPTGEYTATIKVDSGAPSLTGKNQTIYAKYHMCGLEMFPVYGAMTFAFFSATIGTVAAFCVMPSLKKHGLWREVKTAEPKRM